MGMFDFLKRGGKVVEAHANEALDKAEGKDPVVMAKQAIRDMEKENQDAIKANVTVKSNHLRCESDVKSVEESIATWKKQAEQLKAKYQELNGALADASDADKVTMEASIDVIKTKVGEAIDNIAQLETKLVEKRERALKAKGKADLMKKRLKENTQNIKDAKEQLRDMKAQTEMAEAELTMNKNMNSTVGGSAKAMFDKMAERANQLEAEAEAYGDMADDGKSAQQEIDDILNAPTPGAATKKADDFLNS